MTKKSPKDPLVPIRVDRLRAAQQLDGRGWPDIARALGTTHQQLYHLSTGGRLEHRRCRQSLRDGFAQLFEVLPEWLSGQTDALTYVLTADATVVNVSGSRRDAKTRVSLFEGAGHDVPGLQLALDRLLERADAALARDTAVLDFDESIKASGWPLDQVRSFALLLVSSSVEFGLDIVSPLPPIDVADDARISAVRHAEQIYRPWFEGKGRYPEWRLIIGRIPTQVENGLGGLLLYMKDDIANALVDAYEQLRKREDKRDDQ